MEILKSVKQRVLHLTLNRPDKRNALTSAMCDSIIEQVDSAQENDEIGCILITANGSVFCAGLDLDEALPDSSLMEKHERLFAIGLRSLKPIVVGVAGAALGAGLGLAAQGHVIFASDRAVFGLPEIRVGLFPLLVYRGVENAIGNRRTLQAALTGHLFHPDEAYQWGLVHRICPDIELCDRVKVMARELAKASPVAMAAGLEYVQSSRGASSEEATKIGRGLRARVMDGQDFQEGMLAYKERREPRWPSIPASFYERD